MESEIFNKRLTELCISSSTASEKLLLTEYGAMFAARGVRPPTKIVFHDSETVERFQTDTSSLVGKIAGVEYVLQTEAMEALLSAVEAARGEGLNISGRGTDSASRTFDETVGLWNSRVEPALEHWLALGKISKEQVLEIRSSTPAEQVPLVLELEAYGIFFAKDLSKSIIYSVAPPGASQHLSRLAFDVAEFNEPAVREILAQHYWYQTVTSDLPHFTYLGIPEYDLPAAGLKKVESANRTFFVPDI